MKTALVLTFVLCFVAQSWALSLWPLPAALTTGSTKLPVNAASFQFVASGVKSDILSEAFARYRGYTFWKLNTVKSAAPPNALSQLSVIVSTDDQTLQMGMDESYSLVIDANSGATLKAATVWGALRGLETFSQCVSYDSSNGQYFIDSTPVSIQDSPRFQWRGLMIDTARHYLPVSTILHILDAVAYSKFNTLHWHAVDAQSFPLVIDAYPQLSGAGAYVKNAVYTKADMQNVVEYARQRGIRVVIELDGPGHAYSWGLGLPEIVTNCPSYSANINNAPLNPTLNKTYDVLRAVYEEMTSVFNDTYFHVGGDEVVLGCWAENTQVTQWMKDHGIATTLQLYGYFEDLQHKMVTGLNRIAVNWQEVFDNNLGLPTATTVIHVWKNQATLGKVVVAGYKGLLSAGWYLDQQLPAGPTHYAWEDTWINFYQNDPTNGLSLTDAQLQRILGGEAAMWGEQVDQHNFDSRVWPRACAVAERLWSAQTVTDLTSAKQRLSDMSCRLQRRGVMAGPIMPGYCEMP